MQPVVMTVSCLYTLLLVTENKADVSARHTDGVTPLYVAACIHISFVV